MTEEMKRACAVERDVAVEATSLLGVPAVRPGYSSPGVGLAVPGEEAHLGATNVVAHPVIYQVDHASHLERLHAVDDVRLIGHGIDHGGPRGADQVRAEAGVVLHILHARDEPVAPGGRLAKQEVREATAHPPAALPPLGEEQEAAAAVDDLPRPSAAWEEVERDVAAVDGGLLLLRGGGDKDDLPAVRGRAVVVVSCEGAWVRALRVAAGVDGPFEEA